MPPPSFKNSSTVEVSTSDPAVLLEPVTDSAKAQLLVAEVAPLFHDTFLARVSGV